MGKDGGIEGITGYLGRVSGSSLREFRGILFSSAFRMGPRIFWAIVGIKKFSIYGLKVYYRLLWYIIRKFTVCFILLFNTGT